MNDAQARGVILRAWARTGGPKTSTALQTVQAIARYESGYGAPSDPKWAGSHNWGATQAGHAPPCRSGEFQYTDHRRDGTPYEACFTSYASDEDGAAALIRELVRRPAVLAALDSGNAAAVANAMHSTGYFEANPAGYAKGIANVASSIARALAEPVYLTVGGPRPTTTPAGELGGALVIAAILVLIWRDMRARGPRFIRATRPRGRRRRPR